VPVGLFPQSEYQSCVFSLVPGDRLYLYSDGISECESVDGELYGEERLQALLSASRSLPKTAVFECVERALINWCQPYTQPATGNGRLFNDEISLLDIERKD